VSGDVTACGACSSTDLRPLVDLGLQPLAEGVSPGRRYPLVLMMCAACGLAQLSYAVDPAELFRQDHPYSTGNSAALREHYRVLADELSGELEAGDVVVDIGANDGTLLDCYPTGLVTIAVEPTNQGAKGAVSRWYPFFFTAELARMIREQFGPAKVITACNVMAHVPDVHDFIDGVVMLLDDDGIFVTENHDLASVIDGLQIDTIYHEHLRYYSVGSLSVLLERHGLWVTEARPVDTHGGSFRLRARKMRGDTPARARYAATALRAMLHDITQGKRQVVYGVGAATRATPLIHYAGIASMISFVVEVPGSDKLGGYMPGTQVQVIPEQALVTEQPEYALLFAWHMADVIVPRLRAMGYEGKFIVPLPEPKVLDD
jgi:hypothetical protein